jgi:hypothetical protein
VCFGHIKTWTVSLRMPRMMREGNVIFYTLYNSCVRSSTGTMRGSGTSNMVWFVTHLLRALLLDELWT